MAKKCETYNHDEAGENNARLESEKNTVEMEAKKGTSTGVDEVDGDDDNEATDGFDDLDVESIKRSYHLNEEDEVNIPARDLKGTKEMFAFCMCSSTSSLYCY